MPTLPTDSFDSEKEELLAEVLRLLDITRDLDRHQSDSEFSAAGGTIHYVVDENIFEMFVNPQQSKERTATFYSPFWMKRASAAERKGGSSISSQSALLAGEYMLSGQLPGQQGGKILITDWHKFELQSRIVSLAISQKSVIQRILPGATINSGPLENPVPFDASLDAQPFLAEDLRLLQENRIWSNESIERFVVCRTSANRLASDHVFQPIAQLRRLTGDILPNRTVELGEKLNVPSTELDKIESSARVWKDRLIQERNKPAYRTPRAFGALSNDALSLALVQWAARRYIGTRERIVLVTGDRLVFNAFRRWHSSVSPDSEDYLESFILRRPLQYAPIFNMADGVGDIGGENSLFKLTRSGMEVILLPFNLSRISPDPSKQEAISRSREYFALKLTDIEPRKKSALLNDKVLKFFLTHLTPQWLEDSRQRLNDLRILWQQGERAAIGSMYDIIRPCLEDELGVLADEFALPGSEQLGPLLQNYLNSTFDRIVADSINIAFPLARRFINTRMGSVFKRQPRPPILLRIIIPFPDYQIDLRVLLYKWATGEPSNSNFSIDAAPSLTNRPDLVFALAAALALMLGEWNDALRFSELTERAGQARAIKNSDELAEYAYLRAICLRFRMADVSPPRSAGAMAAVAANRHEALDKLDGCLDYHGKHDQPLRRLRALSERASLNLYYSIAIVLSSDSLSPPGPASKTEDITVALNAAESDLDTCLVWEAEIEAYMGDDDERTNNLKLLRRQILINSAGCIMMRHVFLKEQHIRSHRFLHGDTPHRVHHLLRNERDTLPPIVLFDLTAFLYLAGQVAMPKSDLFTRPVDKSFAMLSLDRARIEAMRQWTKHLLS